MSKKEHEQTSKAKDQVATVQAMSLDYKGSRYELVTKAIAWSKILKHKQEYLHLRKNEILNQALDDILSNKIDEKTIAKEMKALEAALAAQHAQGETGALKTKLEDDKEEKPEKAEKETAKK
ncbi:MAG: hypothetical protein AABZ44_01820 [Elusimicrobiota bacterium]